MSRRGRATAGLVTLAIAVVVAAVVVMLSRSSTGGDAPTPEAAAGSRSTATSPAAGRTSTPRDSTAALPPGCSPAATAGFVPTDLSMPHVTRDAQVLALPRDAHGVPGVPPLTDTGKREFAWDAPGVRPGSPRGNVLLNAHTWPDGTALGNALLAHLHQGDHFRLSGHGKVLCYRVTERVEVPADDPPVHRVYDFTDKPQAVLIVCSGPRLGPGDWKNRTLWFASPVTGKQA